MSFGVAELELIVVINRTTARHSKHHRDSLALLASRPPYASVATGSKAAHKRELEEVLAASFDLDRKASDGA